MLQGLNQIWNLENIFPGGSKSEALEKEMNALVQDVAGLTVTVESVGSDRGNWRSALVQFQEVGGRLREAGAFIGCLNAQDVKDDAAKILQGRLQQIFAAYGSAMTGLEKQLLELDEETFAQLLADEEIAPVAFNLEERRQRAAEKLPSDMEKLINDLAVDGYHGWSNLYNVITGRIAIPWEKDGKEVKLSVGQAQNVFSSADPHVRAQMAEKWEAAWANDAELCASALNHLGGFRLNLYKNRGWGEIHKEPLDMNRMTGETLAAMWGAIDAQKDVFVEYLNRKKKLLGLEKLTWYDVHAPLAKVERKFSYDEACNFVVEQFARVSPAMAEFCVQAFQDRWVEAEDRADKRAGAFCTSLPVSKETRVFMTFSGSSGGVSTLAHEMGHAFHSHCLNDLPLMARGYAMNVAETASTFAEMVVADAAVQSAQSDEERIALLGEKVENSISFFMNIHSRFLFETEFYEARRRGPVSVAKLNELMVSAQKRAYKDALDEWHPHFWASKLHFYMTGVPFYNFPYTFGYLFSAGVYALAVQEGAAFEEKYINLLRDTGRMKVEDLALKHLGVDLTKPDFWNQAVAMTVADAQEFLRITK